MQAGVAAEAIGERDETQVVGRRPTLGHDGEEGQVGGEVGRFVEP